MQQSAGRSHRKKRSPDVFGRKRKDVEDTGLRNGLLMGS
jgi:hypothetical protein